MCQSAADCAARQHTDLGSSVGWPASITPDAGLGILSSDAEVNADFAGFNRVFVPYCSGDVWAGDADGASNPFGEEAGGEGGDFSGYFEGHRIVMATLVDLGVLPGAGGGGAAPAADVVLTGCSAGGVGTFLNCDTVGAALAAANDASTLACRPEAGYFGLPLLTYDAFTAGSPDPDMHHLDITGWVQRVAKWPYATPEYAACVADRAHRLTPSDNCTDHEECCTLPPYLYPYIQTRTFVSQNTADAYQVFKQGGSPEAPGATVDAYVEYLRGVLAGSLRDTVARGAANATNGLYAPACLQHCTPWHSANGTVRGTDAARAFGDWYFNRGPPGTHMLLDDSTDLNLYC